MMTSYLPKVWLEFVLLMEVSILGEFKNIKNLSLDFIFTNIRCGKPVNK